MITSATFAGKRYAVLGLARTGLAVVRTLLASGAEVIAWDSREEPRAAVAAAFGARVTLADPTTADLTGCTGVIVSPGVPLNRHPISEAAARYGVPVIGDIELFAMARPVLPPHRVIGITGTNGKSTTTALVHHLLTVNGIPSRMGGNIGLPVLGQEPLQPSDHGTGVYVLELSSYQIDLTQTLACDAAALLNLTPDHLDRYGTFAAYAARFLYGAGAKVATAWMYVTEVALMKPGDSMRFVTPGRAKVAIARQGSSGTVDDFVALSSTCPCFGCQVH